MAVETHYNGFVKEYYIRVQANILDRGIDSADDYHHLYISEITTDPSMQSICECCSRDKEHTQYIKYKFHVKSRKDPDFNMVIGSTCIHQFQEINPCHIEHVMLVFEQERKKLDKMRREDRIKERKESYKKEYAHFIQYLDLYYKLKRVFPRDLYDIYKILTTGRKIFRENHQEVLSQYMSELPQSMIVEKLSEREEKFRKQREEREKLAAMDKENLRKMFLEKLDTIEKALGKTNDTIDFRSKIENGNLSFEISRKINKMSDMVKGFKVMEDKVQQLIDGYAKTSSNQLVLNLISEMKAGKELSPAQYDLIAKTLTTYNQMLTNFKNEINKLRSIDTKSLNKAQVTKLESAKDMWQKAVTYGKFYNEMAEKKFRTLIDSL